MRTSWIAIVSAVALALLSTHAYAFTSRTKATAITVGATGVTSTQSLGRAVVAQNTGVPGTPATLGWGSGVANAFLDSGEAIRVDITTNLPANRLLIYTENSRTSPTVADPKYCGDPNLGNDGGGLVGDPTPSGAGSFADPNNCKFTVPLLWAISPPAAGTSPQPGTNPDHNFGAGVGDNEAFMTDVAHVATFVDAALPDLTPATLPSAALVAARQLLDTLDLRFCAASGGDAPNPDNTGNFDDPQVYPQLFGVANADKDICYEGPLPVPVITDDAGVNILARRPETTTTATCQGVASTSMCPAGSKVFVSEELSKNVAVVAFNCLGTTCTIPNLTTPDPTDSLTVISPFFLPIAADFRTAPGLEYGTSTLTLELVTQ